MCSRDRKVIKRITLEINLGEIILAKVFEKFTPRIYRKGIEDEDNLRT